MAKPTEEKFLERQFGEVGSEIGYVNLDRPLQLIGEDAPGIYDRLTTSPAARPETLVVKSMHFIPSGILVTRDKPPHKLIVPWLMVNHAKPPPPDVKAED
jgi:hypothetical protein